MGAYSGSCELLKACVVCCCRALYLRRLSRLCECESHRRIQPTVLGRGQTSYFGSGARPNGPKPEAKMAESGSGVLGEGTASLLAHQLRGLGSAVSFSSGSVAEPRPVKRFLTFWRRHISSPGTCWGAKLGGMAPCPPPLNPAM